MKVRRIGDVEPSAAPCGPGQAHRKHELLGEDLGVLEAPVAVAVFEHAHPATAGLLLQFVVEIAAGRLGHKQTPAPVESREHREADAGSARDPFDREAVRDVQRRSVGGEAGLRRAEQPAREV